MSIKKILLALTGAVVGFLAGLMIGGLGWLLGGFPGGPSDVMLIMLVVGGLCATAIGYLAFVGAVPMKAILSLAFVVVALWVCAVVIFFRLPDFFALINPPLTTIELRQMLQKCSCEPEIQAEVDSLLSRFDRKESWLLFGKDLSTVPALARFGESLGDMALFEIVPDSSGIPSDLRHYLGSGMPSHLRVRFGQHFHYQYILFFRTGTDASSIMSPIGPMESFIMPPNGPYEHVTGNIYFKPGHPYVRKH